MKLSFSFSFFYLPFPMQVLNFCILRSCILGHFIDELGHSHSLKSYTSSLHVQPSSLSWYPGLCVQFVWFSLMHILCLFKTDVLTLTFSFSTSHFYEWHHNPCCVFRREFLGSCLFSLIPFSCSCGPSYQQTLSNLFLNDVSLPATFFLSHPLLKPHSHLIYSTPTPS